MIVSSVTQDLYTKIEQTEKSIKLEVKNVKEGLESSITQLAGEIELKVEKDGIISAINQTAETIKIQASKIELSGYVTVDSLSGKGTTTIDGSNIKTGIIKATNSSIWLDLNEGRLMYYEGSRFVGASNRLYDNWTGKYGLGMLANTDSFVAFSTGEQDYATIYNPEIVIVGKDTVNKDTGKIRYRKGINIRTDVHGGDYKNTALSWGEFPRSKTDYIALYKGDGGDGTQSELILELGDDYKTNFKIMSRFYNDNSYHMVASFRATGGSEENASSSAGINFYQNLSMQGNSIWGANTLSTKKLTGEEVEVASLLFNTRASAFLRENDNVKYTASICMRANMEYFGTSQLSEGVTIIELPTGFMHSGYIVIISPHQAGNYRIEKFDDYFKVYGDITSFDYIIKGEME